MKYDGDFVDVILQYTVTKWVHANFSSCSFKHVAIKSTCDWRFSSTKCRVTCWFTPRTLISGIRRIGGSGAPEPLSMFQSPFILLPITGVNLRWLKQSALYFLMLRKLRPLTIFPLYLTYSVLFSYLNHKRRPNFVPDTLPALLRTLRWTVVDKS
jgi:hypothetical protein